MKNVRFVLFALTVLLMATAAQAQQTNVKANIPFEFVVGDRAFPAGEYALKSMTTNDMVIRIDNTQEAVAGNTLSNTCRGITPSASTKIVFHHMGDHYFLYQIWTEGNLAGREFSKSREEVQLAQNHETPELVVIAAKITR